MCDIPTYYIEKRFADLQARLEELEQRLEDAEGAAPSPIRHPGPQLLLLLALSPIDADDCGELRRLSEDFCSVGEKEYLEAYLPRVRFLFAMFAPQHWPVFAEVYKAALKKDPPPLPALFGQLLRPQWTPAARRDWAQPAPAKEPPTLPGEEGLLPSDYDEWRRAKVAPAIADARQLSSPLVDEAQGLETQARGTRSREKRHGLLVRAAALWCKLLDIEAPEAWK